MLKILQWNIRSIRANRAQLEQLLSHNDIDIAIIAELWLSPVIRYSVSGYSFIHSPRRDGYGGCGVLVKNNLFHEDLTLSLDHPQPGTQVCGAKIFYGSQCVNILSVYSIVSDQLIVADWMNLIGSLTGPVLVGGDFNGHHRMWGNAFNDRKGNCILEMVEDNNLIILNDGRSTIIPKPNHQRTCVDLTLVSPGLTKQSSWDVIEESLGSDHLAILISLFINERSEEGDRRRLIGQNRWKLRAANWEMYNKRSEELFGSFHLAQDFNESYNNFIWVMNKAAEESIPRIKAYKGRKRRRKRPWWDNDCDKAKEESKRAYTEYKDKSTYQNYIDCLKLTAKTKLLYNQKKKGKWREFCDDLNSTTPIKEIWSKIKGLRGIRQHRPEHMNENCMDEFLNKLTPDYAAENIIQDEDGQAVDEHVLNKDIDMFELEAAIKTNSNTSPGVDQVHYPMIAHLGTRGKLALLKVFNGIWISERAVEAWKDHLVIPLLKPGKDPQLSDSYRPISLASCVGKTYERILKARLNWYLESKSLIPASQNGFRKGHSPLDSVVELTTDIKVAFSNNEFLLAAFIDLSNAYNSVSVAILNKKMKDTSVPKRLRNNIIHMISERRITVQVGTDGPKHRQTGLGLPQGAVLSPDLFNLYTSNLPSVCGNKVKCLQFADDIIMYTIADSVDRATATLNQCIMRFGTWCNNSGFRIAEPKCKVMMFTRRRKYRLQDPLPLGNFHFNVQRVIKFLGMELDQKLIWRQHIDSLNKSCEQAINILRFITHRTFGADPQTCLLIYRHMIRAKLDYGCILYGDAAKTHLQKIDRIQYKALRCCLGALRSTPTNALLVEASEPPLHLRRQMLTQRYTLDRLLILGHPVITKLAHITPRILTEPYWNNKKTPLLITSFTDLSTLISNITDRTKIPPVYDLPYGTATRPNPNIYPHFHDFDIQIPKEANNQLFVHKLNNQFPNRYLLYTDGSKADHGVGCALYDPQTETARLFKLHPQTSIYTAEKLALLLTIQYIQTIEQPCHFVICTDSRSALQKLEKPGHKIDLLTHRILKMLLDMQQSKKTVSMVWVKGHSGCPGNDMADIAAKKAVEDGEGVQDAIFPFDLGRLFKENMVRKWRKEWEESQKERGRYYSLVQPTLQNTPWFTHLQDKRENYITLSRLRFGHNRTRFHLHRIHATDHPFCSCGDQTTIADQAHLLLDCPTYKTFRQTLYSAIDTSGFPQPIHLPQMLTTPHTNKLTKHLLHFITQTKIHI
jgi:ribonuclease HI